jgi:tetratricopeptide (TPR) repeat protein
MLLRRQGLWKDAKKNNRKALTVPLGDAGLSYNIGVAYADGKEYDTALAYFEKALEADPELIKQAPPVGYTIVTDHHRCRNLPEPRNFLRAVLELDPNYEPASRLLGPLAS